MLELAAPIPSPGPNAAPDWSDSRELACPLCGYNLRGLTNGLCPECGFTFQWQELLAAEKNRHPYLFEYGKGRNVKTFWKTYFWTCRPRRFWTDLNPAQPVHLFRLILYWLLASGLLLAVCVSAPSGRAAKVAQDAFSIRTNVTAGITINYFTGLPWTQAEIDESWPVPWQLHFWGNLFSRYGNRILDNVVGAVVFLAWPWLTLLALLIFRFSMQRAKIRSIHLLRTALYSCDFGLLLIFTFVLLYFTEVDLAGGWMLVLAAIVCSLITTYRLTIAFQRYLRVHQPLATQLISFLIVFVLLVTIADFARHP